MKNITYVGNVQAGIFSFPEKARQRIMTALTMISANIELPPKDFKYMPIVGAGCYELRIRMDKQYRIMYVAKYHEAIYVLHAFVKKTEQTSKSDIEIAAKRYQAMTKYRMEKQYDRKD
jgi:phage-related protein